MLIRTALTITALAMVLTGCGLSYFIKNGYHQGDLLRRRVPIEDVLNDPSTSEDVRKKLRLSQDIRKFADEKIGLTLGKNYTSYVDLHRDYVTWTVTAAYRNRLEGYLWHYPIVGSLPYKGFFVKDDASNEAKKMKDEGFDVFVRGVAAFSTLGWFKDPILSSMLRMKEEDFVNILIHESVHSTIFIESKGSFNERLATFIGNKGTEWFYRDREGANSPHLKAIAIDNGDDKKFSEFISAEIRAIREWYMANPSVDEPTRLKRLSEIQTRFTKELKPKLEGETYLAFATGELNNARLSLFETYLADITDLEKAYSAKGSDLRAFVAYAKTLESSKDPEVELKKY